MRPSRRREDLERKIEDLPPPGELTPEECATLELGLEEVRDTLRRATPVPPTRSEPVH